VKASVGTPPAIDRHPQYLPVPLGGSAPVRVQPPRRRRVVGAHLQTLVSVAGIGCAAVGLGLLASPPTAVYLTGDRLQVGGMVLHTVGPIAGVQTVLFGGDASYVLAEPGNGSATASAAWMTSGGLSAGVCHLHPAPARLIDECKFALSTGQLTSIDVLELSQGAQWQRTYGDGVRVSIAVPSDGAAVPVPFPIGH
jgi:hypothetical protein